MRARFTHSPGENIEMGSAASVTNGGRDNFDKYGDRIEVTKSFPVGSFGRDNTNSVARSGQNGEKTLTSSGSISEEKVRERSSSKQSKSRRSLGSFLGFNSKIKSEECERAQSDGNLHSDEMPEFELTRLMKKNNELQQEKERHKRELESLRKGKTKWQNNCLKAEEDVVQAKERARAFEDGMYFYYSILQNTMCSGIDNTNTYSLEFKMYMLNICSKHMF